MSALRSKFMPRFFDYLLASSGTLVPMAGYIFVAFLASTNKAEVSIFLIILGYVSATSSLLGHVTGPNFISAQTDINKKIHHILFCNLFVLLFLFFLLSLYNFFNNIIDSELLICAFFITFSQLINPFWYAQKKWIIPRIFAILSIVRILLFICIIVISRNFHIEFINGVWVFAFFSLILSLTFGGASQLKEMYSNRSNIINGSISYINEIRPLIIGLQMNLFVSYIMPIFSLIFIDSIHLYMFFIFDRFRYMSLALGNSFYTYWQRRAFDLDLNLAIFKKWRIYTFFYSFLVFLMFLVSAEILQEYAVISLHDKYVGIWIGGAASLGILGSYLGNVECVLRKNYKIILRANIVSLTAYVISVGPLLMALGSIGLSISTIILEICILFVICKYIISLERVNKNKADIL